MFHAPALLLGLGIAAALGAGAYILSHKAPTLKTMPGHWYRVHFASDTFAGKSSISDAAKTMGWQNASAFLPGKVANTPDALDTTWTCIAQAGDVVDSKAGSVDVLAIEEVSAPSVALVVNASPDALDANLSALEKAAVLEALKIETAAANLTDFSQAMAGDFPIASSKLALKAGKVAAPSAHAPAPKG